MIGSEGSVEIGGRQLDERISCVGWCRGRCVRAVPAQPRSSGQIGLRATAVIIPQNQVMR